MDPNFYDYVKEHPNWAALATVYFPYKRFIQANSSSAQEDLENIEKKHEIKTNSTGEEIREFYETMTQNTKVQIVKEKPIENKNIEISMTQEKKIIFDINKYFRAATHNDVATLKSFMYKGDSINITDQYGWSALMMASCENSFEAVSFLLSQGANKDIKDKKGNNALSLSRQKGFVKIFNLINDYRINQINNSRNSRNKDSNAKLFPYYCSICNDNFKIISKKAHESSTVHLFNIKTEKRNSLRYSTISDKNRGLKLMLKQGWDRENGLGPSGSGNLFPIKTIIRKTRSGLGTEQNSAKVTHFKPYDLSAIKYKPPAKSKSRNEMRREQRRNQKQEKRLRKELS